MSVTGIRRLAVTVAATDPKDLRFRGPTTTTILTMMNGSDLQNKGQRPDSHCQSTAAPIQANK